MTSAAREPPTAPAITGTLDGASCVATKGVLVGAAVWATGTTASVVDDTGDGVAIVGVLESAALVVDVGAIEVVAAVVVAGQRAATVTLHDA